jgi:hypothetical protein
MLQTDSLPCHDAYGISSVDLIAYNQAEISNCV